MKRGIALSILIVVLIFAGCSNVNKQKQEDENIDLPAKQEDENVAETNQDEEFVQYEGEKIYLSFDEAIDQSYCVVTAKLNSINDKKTYREYDFTLEQVIIGDMTDSSLSVSEGYTENTINGSTYSSDMSYSTLNTEYKVGNEYILVLYKISSVYFEDTYKIAGDIFIQLDDAGNIVRYQRYHEDEQPEFGDIKEFTDYIMTFIDPSEERSIIGVPYTDSTEISDIVDASQYVIKAVIRDIYKELPNKDWTIYRCDVTESLRGKTEDEVLILLFRPSSATRLTQSKKQSEFSFQTIREAYTKFAAKPAS